MATLPLVSVTARLDDTRALRGQLDRDEFLYVAGLLPPAEIDGLRRDVLACCRRAGWLREGDDPLDDRGASRSGTPIPPSGRGPSTRWPPSSARTSARRLDSGGAARVK